MIEIFTKLPLPWLQLLNKRRQLNIISLVFTIYVFDRRRRQEKQTFFVNFFLPTRNHRRFDGSAHRRMSTRDATTKMLQQPLLWHSELFSILNDKKLKWKSHPFVIRFDSFQCIRIYWFRSNDIAFYVRPAKFWFLSNKKNFRNRKSLKKFFRTQVHVCAAHSFERA